jgi:hypothetical protein
LFGEKKGARLTTLVAVMLGESMWNPTSQFQDFPKGVEVVEHRDVGAPESGSHTATTLARVPLYKFLDRLRIHSWWMT